MKYLLAVLSLAFSASLFSGPAMACGPDTDCTLGDRHYRIRMPEGHDGTTKIAAIVWSHGYRGSARGMMNNKSMARLASELGVALVATKSFGEDWNIPGMPKDMEATGEVELEYFDAVIEDITTRFPIDETKLVSSGFSAGGMMIWNLICHRSDRFAGFIPIAGTFWEPTPETCTSPPANIVHIHGTTDRTVPLTGRKILKTRQGNVFKVLDMYVRYGGYGDPQTETVGSLNCENRTNPEKNLLNFCTFDGGHSFRSEYVRIGWEMLKAAGKL